MKDELLIKYIPKKKGYRKIVSYNVANQKLRQEHKHINKFICDETIPSKFAKAYIKNRSIILNAKMHMYNDIFIYMDIKKFFASINHTMMVNLLFKEINKRKPKIIITKDTCYKIVKSCAISSKGLAEGVIPSPTLSNIYLKEFDNILYGYLNKMHLENIRYTRYADDMIISFKDTENYNVVDIVNAVTTLLKRYKLELNKEKTKIISLNRSNHVRLTGIIISKDSDNNRSLTVGRKRKNELYNKAISLAKKNKDIRLQGEINKVKGMQSFILSVEGIKYEEIYSDKMISIVRELGYEKLKQLIDNL
ncbi:reverse transcriptase family protein [Cellulosilyticum sp. I15G10I2]|uniref:reverse transcriptase family protein n=1 Tax=Cellulosilyticum sp. I15G10I2 TaxID=1892843 RepID=UPI00085BD00C|nr:reverse transcriptase family protein [Cellulosilyticum sp. I15G10I2]